MPLRAQGWLNAIHAAALLLVAICLGPAFAHLFELPNKMGLGREDYFTVQQIYRGWALFGIPIFAAIAVTLVLAWMARRQPHVAGRVLAALACLLAAQALFWIFTNPANVATQNWTVMPDDWAVLRARWEYSHAAGAVLTFGALAALAAALFARLRGPA
jgi:hypothetical protein